MITSNDIDYKETKAIVNGQKKPSQEIKVLRNWIEDYFKIKVLYIVQDHLDTLNKPRLNVVLEEYQDVNKFNDKNYNYDSVKQGLISNKFVEIKGENTKKKSFIKRFFEKPLDKYFVCFSAFNPIAKSDIVDQIPSNQLANFKRRNINGSVWQIHDSSMGMIVFVHKDEEIETFKVSGKFEILKEEFYEMVKPYDKRGYFNLDNISVGLDSKQNFDENYESNWYYYYN